MAEDENDRAFIDRDDDHADLLTEYEDKQNFDDERPDDDDEWGGGKKKKYKSSSSANNASNYSSSVSGVGSKILDPLSQTLLEMKNPKIKEMAEMEKEMFVEKLQKKMNKG